MIPALTLVLAACSMVYELLLAQTLAATMGSTVLRYNLTIGLYLASLGAGAFLYGRKERPEKARLLVDVELALSAVGATAPALVLAVDALAGWLSGAAGLDRSGLAVAGLVTVLDHALIVAIGVLSGYELPLLMALGAEERPGTANRVLVADYLGSVLAAVAFPLALLPVLGVFGTAFLTGGLNALVALVVIVLVARTRGALFPRGAAAGLLAAALAAALVSADAVSRLAVSALYLRGL